MMLIATVDFLISATAYWLAALIRAGFNPADMMVNLGPVLPRTLAFAALIMLGLASMGLYRSRQRANPGEMAARVAFAVIMGVIAFVLFFFFFPGVATGRGVVAISTILASVGLFIGRFMMLRVIDWNPVKRNVLVLGSGEIAGRIGMLRRRSDRRRFHVVGYVPVDSREAEHGARFGLRPLLEFEDAIANNLIDEIVVATDSGNGELPVRELLEKKSQGIRITDIVSFLEEETGRIDLDVMDPEWMIFSESKHASPIYCASKRAMDILFGLTMLLLSSPIFLFVYLAIKIEGGWRAPAFFRQDRVGRYDLPFELLKFRSMIVNAEAKSGPQWSARSGDARITVVGRLIRRFRADELPQLINVLRGDMSIVGPRPERPEFVQGFSVAIPFYDYRHSVRPGLTGWAQLNFPYGESEEDARTKLMYDLYYIHNVGFILDLSILLQTLEVVVWGRAISMMGPGGPRLDQEARRDFKLFKAKSYEKPGGTA